MTSLMKRARARDRNLREQTGEIVYTETTHEVVWKFESILRGDK